jgi:hypothetical protein
MPTKYSTALGALSISMITAGVASAQDHQTILPRATPLNIPGAYMPGELPPEPPEIAAQPSAGETHRNPHTAWTRIPNMKMIKPHLVRRENTFHAPATDLRAAGNLHAADAATAQTTTTNNWSGVAVAGTPGQYRNAEITMSFGPIPYIAEAFGCTLHDQQWHYTTIWTGTDGFGSGTVEQAGIQVVSDCDGPEAIYAFIETYPQPEVYIDNFSINVGDMIDVWVWLTGSSTCAAWENETRNTFTSACLTNPGPIQASSIEWVVERPFVGPNLATLGNYITIPAWSQIAWDQKTGGIFGAAASEPTVWNSTGSFYWINMLDGSGNVISEPNTRWWDTTLFYATGSAYCSAGTICQPRY